MSRHVKLKTDTSIQQLRRVECYCPHLKLNCYNIIHVNLFNHSGRTRPCGFAQPLTKMSTRNIKIIMFLGSKVWQVANVGLYNDALSTTQIIYHRMTHETILHVLK
jgi:hypothetical protein